MHVTCIYLLSFFFFTDTTPTEIYTLSLHDALPICREGPIEDLVTDDHIPVLIPFHFQAGAAMKMERSEEHTSELQSLTNLVCRLLLEKKKNKTRSIFCWLRPPQR